MYGGRVIDDFDRRVVNTYMDEYMGDFIFDTFQPFHFYKNEEVRYPKSQMQLCTFVRRKRVDYSILEKTFQLVDNRMRFHGLRQLADDKSVESCQNLLSTCCKLFQQVMASPQMTSCNKPNFNRLVAT